MTNTDHYAIGFVIMACSLSLTFCVVKFLGQLEQSRCSYITTACCKVERDLSSRAHVIDVPAPLPGGVVRHMHAEDALKMVTYRSDDGSESEEDDGDDDDGSGSEGDDDDGEVEDDDGEDDGIHVGGSDDDDDDDTGSSVVDRTPSPSPPSRVQRLIAKFSSPGVKQKI